MSIAGIIKKLPEYADDIKKNLTTIFIDGDCELSQHQLFGVALATGYSLRHEHLLNGIRAEAKLYLEDIDAMACKMAAIVMAMYNTFYKFISFINDDEIVKMRDGLYNHAMSTLEVAKQDMEMYVLAVSILNGCSDCVKMHTASLLKYDISKRAIRDIARVVAVLRATVDALEIERMRSYDFVVRDASID